MEHVTREEGVALVRLFDGEFPQWYFREVMDYIEVIPKKLFELEEKFCSSHLWAKSVEKLCLRHTVCIDATGD